jgi:hypothetical protein
LQVGLAQAQEAQHGDDDDDDTDDIEDVHDPPHPWTGLYLKAAAGKGSFQPIQRHSA